ncbi:endonuclease/exonuclease/phosphatase family protein [Streptantibioticus ferralitis]|uniref:Endonuclease/exonuclease/phosphatase family protein n=1 Tax=Streptantibioticus ferralitis TaxID=236510 RepID=A0ABT5Z8X0_9ACTN|nr:endonuclease/exonuclease/phosphatase family protein [Streptantibioticus ferralitis]MDF2259996.1 endonuclease/exonuclease/phosphatase family protein [Streptantibioticus ferralitis]
MAQTDTADGQRSGNEARPGQSGASRTPNRWRDGGSWRRGWIPAAIALVVAVLMFFHSSVPNSVGNLGSLLETFLPWTGLVVPVLLAVALVRRSATALVALLVPALVWLNLFGGLLTDKSSGGGNLTVVSHNVNADNPNPAATAKDIAGSGADIVALEELTGRALPVYERGLAGTYRYHAVEGTVALWSKYPLSGTQPVNIRLGWVRALRTTVATPRGAVAVYVAHMPSVRVRLDSGFTAGQRDHSAVALGDAIAQEPVRRVILLGDLNGTMNDRSLSPITAQMRSAQGAAGDGFGFSWPASSPMARIDQIMVKGIEPTRSWVLRNTGSDHLPVAATLRVA